MAGKEVVVIDLLDESDDDDNDDDTNLLKDPFATGKKRPRPEDCDPDNRKQAAAPSNDVATARPRPRVIPRRIEAPIKLFATTMDEQDRSVHHNKNHHSWTQCRTLREMLRVDHDVESRPRATIEWLVIANYIIHLDFLLDLVPELLSIKRVVIFYGDMEGDVNVWKAACPPDHSLDLIPLRPSDPARSNYNPLPYSIPYGVHHSKLFLLGYSDDTCRLVVHTANLRHGDIHLKAQSAYIQDFPLKRTTIDEIGQRCEFENSLISYMDTYAFHVRRNWLQQHTESPELLTETLRRYDFQSASVVLLPSVPGYHKLDATELLGHWKLRKIVGTRTSEPSSSPRQDGIRPIVCQFSSIGSLTDKYLRELQISMDTSLSRSFRHESIDANMPIRLQLVYPTVDEIRSSIEGYSGGGSFPGSAKNVAKPFLQKLWHKWSGGSNNSNTNNQRNPLCKPSYVPHVKSYYQLCRAGAKDDDGIDDDYTGDAMEWLVVTSHNLSKAAWGEVQTSNRFGGRRLFIRHWELGVFLSPSTLQTERLVGWTMPPAETAGDSNDNNATTQSRTATVPMPYNARPEAYQAKDKPWAVDSTYTPADKFGRHSASDG